MISTKADYKTLVTNPEETTTTLNGTLTLTAISFHTQILLGTATGYSIVMPDATTLEPGQQYVLYNASSQPIIVKTNGGATLFTLSQTSTAHVALRNNGTAAGIWIAYQVASDSDVASGILSYKITSEISFSTNNSASTPITDFQLTPVAGRYAVWINAEWESSNANASLGLYVSVADIDVTDATRTIIIGNANRHFPISTMTTVLVTGAQIVKGEISTTNGTVNIINRTMLLIRLGAT